MSNLQERREIIELNPNKKNNTNIKPFSQNSLDDYMDNNFKNKNQSTNAKYNPIVNDNDNYQYDTRNENNFNAFSTRNSHKNEFMNQINSDKSFSRITDRYNIEKKNKLTFNSKQKERKKNLSVVTMPIENFSK